MTTKIKGRLWMRLISYQVLDQYMEFRAETNRSLAAKAGISPATISHLRSGARDSCRPVTARKIAFALQVLPESLFLPQVTTESGAVNLTRSAPHAQRGKPQRGAMAPTTEPPRGARRKAVA